MTDTSAPEVFGPGHREWCPNAPGDDPGHCSHWYDCEPCHRCGDDTPDPGCDCVRCWAARTIRPGRFVDQTVLADPDRPEVMGNCWQTCIAGLLDLPLDQVPHFVQDHETMDQVEAATRAWLANRGYAMVRVGVLEVDAHADMALTLLCGTSPRGVAHAVIGRGTDVLHDPHPSKAGLERVTDVFLLGPLDPMAIPEDARRLSRSKPTELWFGPDAETGHSTPWDAYEHHVRYWDDEDLGPWTLERYSVRPTVDHLPDAEWIMAWSDAVDEEAGDLPLSAELLLEELHEWAADHGEVDEWWCEQLSSVPSQVADPFITNPSITTANGLRAAVAAEISYVMAGTMLDVHELARTADGKVLLDGVQIGEWTPKVTCCRACEGTPIGEHGQRLRHPTCGTCGSADCPRATAHLNTLCQGVDNR